MNDKKEERCDQEASASFIANQVGTAAASNQAAATDEMVSGMEIFRKLMGRVKNKKVHYRRGHAFEGIIAAKENAENALQGSKKRVYLTHMEGRNTDPVDLETRLGKKVVSVAQAKFTVHQSNRIIQMIDDPKYADMEIYIPGNRIDGVQKELLTRAKNAANPEEKARLHNLRNRIHPHNTSTIEVRAATKHPQLYAMQQEMKYLAKEAGATASYAAASGFVITGALSGIQNVLAVTRGEISTKEAVRETGKQAAKSSLRSGGASVLNTGIRYGAQKVGLKVIAEGNIAAVLGSSLIEVGGVVWDFSIGKISVEEAAEKLGQNGTGTLSSLYIGAAGGMVLGPVGAVVGSIAGYMIATAVYESCIIIFRNAKLAEEQANRLVALAEVTCQQMETQRTEFERLLEEGLQLRRDGFAACFAAIDKELDEGDTKESTLALANFVHLFGKTLQFEAFEEFDSFMNDQETTLKL